MSPGRPAMPSAKRDDYGTPRDLFDGWWDEAGGFDVDPCTSPDHYTARRVLANAGTIYVKPPPELDHTITGPTMQYLAGGKKIIYNGLEGEPWQGDVAFCNPPYGLVLRKWVPRMVQMVEEGHIDSVWALLPARTSTVWWQQYVMQRAYVNEYNGYKMWSGGSTSTPVEVRFLPGRLKFEGAPWSATFPSALIIWGKRKDSGKE